VKRPQLYPFATDTILSQSAIEPEFTIPGGKAKPLLARTPSQWLPLVDYGKYGLPMRQ
jgi:hypothetical protein